MEKLVSIALIFLSGCNHIEQYEQLNSRITDLKIPNNTTVLYVLGSNSCNTCKNVYSSYFFSENVSGVIVIDTFKTRPSFSSDAIVVHDKGEILSRIHIKGLSNERKIVVKNGVVVSVENITMENYKEVMR